jgi:hypothetical protein
MTKRKLLWPVLVMVALLSTVLAVASIRKRSESRTVKPPLVRPSQNPIVTPTDQAYVRVAQLWPQLRWHLKALGDRIEKPGKERITITGTIKRVGDAQASPMTVTLEFPDRLRLIVQDGLQQRIVTFNGQGAASVGPPLTPRERDFIETLVYDTAEHFFGGQARGTATRFLGDHFRLDDGAQANYAGPFYEVYQTTELVNHVTPAAERTKLYCFNSQTQLLETVRYQRQSPQIEVEIRISGWQQIQGQQVPTRIVRKENNQPVLTLTINSAILSATLNDGIFGQ